MSAFRILIPARLNSERLPRKPLADIAGRPLIVRVVERARASEALSVHVVTDSDEIAETVERFGGAVVRSQREHASGTDRLAEAVDLLDLPPDTVVVNLQGDEPLMPAGCLSQVAQLLESDSQADLATLWWPIDSESAWRDPNVVKLVTDRRGRALYFSRAPVPHVRDGSWPQAMARRHIGLYAYRVGSLRAWPGLPASGLESCERLEQLRALGAGWHIVCAQALQEVPAGVDTPQDLDRVCRQLAGEAVLPGRNHS